MGAHLANHAATTSSNLYYWRERDHEIDFVLQHARDLVAIEVKSSAASGARSGLDAFRHGRRNVVPLIVGDGGVPLETFLSKAPHVWAQV